MAFYTYCQERWRFTLQERWRFTVVTYCQERWRFTRDGVLHKMAFYTTSRDGPQLLESLGGEKKKWPYFDSRRPSSRPSAFPNQFGYLLKILEFLPQKKPLWKGGFCAEKTL
ncbi:MAG: hypothetical protein HQL95_13400 [Magnetococcales bacterium]|nr:hypothetical protein [Magnetococcales bacterium]